MNDERLEPLSRLTTGAPTRRGVIFRALGVLATPTISLLGPWTNHIGQASKRKRRRKKRDRCRLLRGSRWVSCGDACCQKGRQVCCDDPLNPSGKSCSPLGGICCPLEFGGGSCRGDEQCCPPGLTNVENRGCCPALSSCCATNEDCRGPGGDPGAICASGCCVVP